MRKPWEQRLHGLVIALHPRAFRDEFGEEMRIVMKDLLEDPDVTRRRVWLAMLGDLGNAMNGGVKLGVISGVVILAICVANRAVDLGAADPSPNISFAVIALILIAAAYSGTRRGGLLRGIGVGVVAGAVSSLSFAADYLFGFRWFSDPMFVGVLIMSIVEGMSLVLLGALMARLPRRLSRFGRAFHAFRSALEEEPG